MCPKSYGMALLWHLTWFILTTLSNVSGRRKCLHIRSVQSLCYKIYLRYIKGVKVVRPLNYMPYIKADALKMLEAEYGWKPYPQKHFESRFTKFYEGYWLPERFGFDTRRVQYSSLIRNQANVPGRSCGKNEKAGI